MEKEAAKAEKDARKAVEQQVKLIQNLCSKALQKISATKAKLERAVEDKALMEKASVITRKKLKVP